jgi:hypothetical protein
MMLSRRIVTTTSSARIGGVSLRLLTGKTFPVDVEHYTSGWNIEDIKDFTKSGKFNVQTYNKISPTVRNEMLHLN